MKRKYEYLKKHCKYMSSKLPLQVIISSSTSSRIQHTKKTPILKLDNVVTNRSIDEATLELLRNLDGSYVVVRNLCTYLSIYHLMMIYTELGEDQSNWQLAIATEMEKRIIKFNWQCGYTVDGTHSGKLYRFEHKIILSESLYMTQINSGITFFDINFPRRIQYLIPKWHYKRSKQLYRFLMTDITFGLDMPYLCIGVNKVKFYTPDGEDYQSTIYTSLFFPPIPSVGVKYCNNPAEFASMLAEDEILMCLMVFAADECRHEIDWILDSVTSRQSPDIPIAGAYEIRRIMRNTFFPHPDYNMYIAFTRVRASDANFVAATMLTLKNEVFEPKLLEFKGNLVRHKEEFCIHFTSSDDPHPEEDWQLIVKHLNCLTMQFEVPGIFANANSMADNHDKEPSVKRPRPTTDLAYSRASVLLYIGWGATKEA